MSEPRVKLPRRRFLKSALGVGAALAAPQLIPGTALGMSGAVAPSERIVMGGIGIGNRGGYDLSCFLPAARRSVRGRLRYQGSSPPVGQGDDRREERQPGLRHYRDFRDLLARDDIDAVLIATGPNWHCTAAIYAARAGKDMYCEKPCTKNISQSLHLAETMRRTGRIFQAGTQRRNLPHFAFACELARTGRLGKLRTVYATRPD